MNNMVQGFLDNDSFFGRFMTKLGIIIAANIMFVLLSIPFFTIGAGFSALYYVMFRTLRNDGVVNPFKEFWTGLRMNFKQATITWILFVYAIGAAAVILYLYLIPVMTVFEDSLPHLIRNTVYFLCKKPLRTLVILFFDIFPFVLTFSDLQSLPLYAFLWVLCGFGLQAMLAATLLLPVFAPYLDAKAEDRNEGPSEESEEYPMTEEEILEDMRKLGM